MVPTMIFARIVLDYKKIIKEILLTCNNVINRYTFSKFHPSYMTIRGRIYGHGSGSGNWSLLISHWFVFICSLDYPFMVWKGHHPVWNPSSGYCRSIQGFVDWGQLGQFCPGCLRHWLHSATDWKRIKDKVQLLKFPFANPFRFLTAESLIYVCLYCLVSDNV